MLVSPETMNTVTVIRSGTGGRLVNHSASAQDCMTSVAAALPALCLESTSWKASNISRVSFRPATAAGASAGSSRTSTSPPMLYPPCMVPRSSTARTGSTSGDAASPLATAVSQDALT